MNEFSLIEIMRSHLGPPSSHVEIGIGDDAASLKLPTKKHLLFCSDAMVEGVHFDLRLASPEDIGHKALASALSDIAAMNGSALYATISLALPSDTAPSFIDGFYRSIAALARLQKVDIVGGDLTRSPGPIFIDIACIGETSHPISRSNAKPGDWLAVSGFPGTSAAGLHALKTRSRDQIAPTLINAHLRPQPRFDLLSSLNREPDLCTSLIDISDGLSSEIHRLAKSSGVGFLLDTRKLPFRPEVLSLAAQDGIDPLQWSLGGGEDYELLATLNPASSPLPPVFTVIGRATEAREGIHLIDRHGQRLALNETGFDHFASS